MQQYSQSFRVFKSNIASKQFCNFQAIRKGNSRRNGIVYKLITVKISLFDVDFRERTFKMDLTTVNTAANLS